MPTGIPMKKLTSCDTCRSRKVRCLKEREEDAACIFCVKRGDTCHFSPVRVRKSANSSRASFQSSASTQHVSPRSTIDIPASPTVVVQETSILPSPNSVQIFDEISSPANLINVCESVNTSQDIHLVATPVATSKKSYIDEILFSDDTPPPRATETTLLTGPDEHVGSSALVFFTEKSMLSLSQRLGHDKVRQLITAVEAQTKWRQNLLTDVDPNCEGTALPSELEGSAALLSDDTINTFIDRYFEDVHPMYPILTRQWFDRMRLTFSVEHGHCNNKPFAAIYWTVLALGCMHVGGGSFIPGRGLAWELFSKSLALYGPVMLSKKLLISAQALCLMALYSMTLEGFRYEILFITEAARAAAALSKTQMQGEEDELARRRTFWTIYCLEKELSFHTTMASLICDEDVGCPLPKPTPTLTNGLDWIRTWAGLCRIMSRAYTSLFCLSSRSKSENELIQEIDSIKADTEAWKQSIPERLRPGEPLQSLHLSSSNGLGVALRLHLLYHGFVSSIARFALHVGRNGPTERLADSRWTLMLAARSIVSATQYIPQEPFTAMILLMHMPIVATFILFDFAVYNPCHAETKTNLAFLDVAAGYFTRLELVCISRGGPPGANLGDFATIARQYINSRGTPPRDATGVADELQAAEVRSPAWTGTQAAIPGTFGTTIHSREAFSNALATPLSNTLARLPAEHSSGDLLDIDMSGDLEFPVDHSLLGFDFYAWNYNTSDTFSIE